VTVHCHPKLGRALKFHPIVIAGQALGEASVMHFPPADEEIEIVCVILHDIFSPVMVLPANAGAAMSDAAMSAAVNFMVLPPKLPT